MEHFYRADFHLSDPVSDYTDASDYLTEFDTLPFLKEKINQKDTFKDAFEGFPLDDILFMDWVLDDVDRGHVDVRTAQVLNEAQASAISAFIRGEISDGIGEGFEQQTFANYIDLSEYEEARDSYEQQRDSINDEYANDDDPDAPCEEDYEIQVVFDWRTNDYKLADVTEQSYKKLDKMRDEALVLFNKTASVYKDCIDSNQLCTVYFQNGYQEDELRTMKEFTKDIDEIFDDSMKGMYAFIINAGKVLHEGTVCDKFKIDVSEKLNKIANRSKGNVLKNER